MKKVTAYHFALVILLLVSSCSENFLDALPEDKITSISFWKDEADVNLALNGIYSVLRDRSVYGYGPGFDACTPNGYQWAYWEGNEQQIGDGSLTTATTGLVTDRWTACYKIIYRVNYFLENLGTVEELDDSAKKIYTGQAHFLRGIAYSLLAETYGGVPIIDSTISTEEAASVKRASLEQTWNKAIADFDVAISTLPVTTEAAGKATLGAALGMKMRAYLYQNKYPQVLQMAASIDSLAIYSLYPSYHDMFQVANEDNEGVIFDVQYISGQNGQGNIFDRYFQPQNLAYGVNGSNSVAPIQDLVDAYEMKNGKPISDASSGYDPDHPYVGRDPRLDFTILRPGAYFQGQLYPVEIKNHTGQRVGFGIRKYTDETEKVIPLQSPLNFIVLRYANVILAKAEALIETGQDINQAIDLINRIRTERTDVKIAPLPHGLSQSDARKALRHERRIEFAFEGQYWADVKRWNIGKEVYPVEVRAADGSLIETKFSKGYDEKYNLLPIPEDQISLNTNLTQNKGW